jgi:Polyketide cyclase / dehydrase and lipid transport
MAEVSAVVPVSRQRVFDVLADGWVYGLWVVGASHIRQVDGTWPEVGSRIHHSSGPWPLQVEDVTVVRAAEPPRILELEAKLWPIGTARVRLQLDEYGPNVTQVRMTEHAERGPARWVPHALQAAVLVPRNRESLRRLADLAVNRQPAERPTG